MAGQAASTLSSAPCCWKWFFCVLFCVYIDDKPFLHHECPCLTTILSSSAESDVLRGDPPLNCQSTGAPHGACLPMVDAAEFESIAQCPQELPQMMAAGKDWRPVTHTHTHTRDHLHSYQQSLLSHENRCGIRGQSLGTEGGCEIQEKPKKKKKKLWKIEFNTVFWSFLFCLISAFCFLILFTHFISPYF